LLVILTDFEGIILLSSLLVYIPSLPVATLGFGNVDSIEAMLILYCGREEFEQKYK
jgi:hypothetical protein